jgi:hypothetical protein
MKTSLDGLSKTFFKKIKNASQKILQNFFVSEVFIKNAIFSMLFDDN